MSGSDVRLIAFSRIHFGLIDLGYATHRAFGGAGLSLSAPVSVIDCSAQSESLVVDLPESLEERTKGELLAALDRLQLICGPIRVRLSVHSHIPEHVGLGSKTALILGTLSAARAVLSLSISDEQVQQASMRGRGSGVGVHSFFTGGAVVDCGQPRVDGQEFLPSSSSVGANPSPMIIRLPTPDTWLVHLVLVPGLRRTQEQEVAFFKASTPLADAEVLSTLAATYHGIVPALLAGDVPLLREALLAIHSTGFKRRELETQDRHVQEMYAALVEADVGAVGLSSMGPLLYVITDVEGGAGGVVAQLAERFRATLHLITTPRSAGYSLE